MSAAIQMPGLGGDWEVADHQPPPDHAAEARRYGMLANGAAHAAAQHSAEAQGHAELAHGMLEAFRAEVSQLGAFAQQAADSAVQAVAAAQKAAEVATEVMRVAQETASLVAQARESQDAHREIVNRIGGLADGIKTVSGDLSRAVEAMTAPRRVVRDAKGQITEVKIG